MRQRLRELNGQNELLRLGQEHDQYVHDLQAERGDAGPVLAALRQRGRQIDEVLRVLQRAEEAREVYDAACQALDGAESALRDAQILSRDAQTQERDERDKLLEAFARWREQSAQLDLPQEVWLEIRRALTTYRVPADWSPLRDQIDGCARRAESELRSRLLRAEDRRDALSEQQREQERTLQQIWSQSSPVPPRRDQIQATRLQLMLRGIPGAPLYELVDFAPGLPSEAQDLLEAQLADTGLLDALVVPEAHLPEIRELLEDYPDRFLVPGPPVGQPLQGLVPDAAGRFPRETAACLAGISGGSLEAETALLPDGRFRCGMLRGRSHAAGAAGFVGAAAREANRSARSRSWRSSWSSWPPRRAPPRPRRRLRQAVASWTRSAPRSEGRGAGPGAGAAGAGPPGAAAGRGGAAAAAVRRPGAKQAWSGLEEKGRASAPACPMG